MKSAVLLDRDGVLIEDVDLVTRTSQMRILPGVAPAMRALREAGFLLVMVSNQAVVARGLATEREVEELHRHLDNMLQAAGAPALDGMYFCPHHPNATLAEYRVVCDCRKPAPGMVFRAAREHDMDLARSFIVGDRPSDILAGSRAGCRTVLVETGKHNAPSIESADSEAASARPNHVCSDLSQAADWIIEQQQKESGK